MPDATHDARLRSSVDSANGHPEFPIQNLPVGIFSPPGGTPRGGVAIGDRILDLRAAAAAGLFSALADNAARVAGNATLNAWLRLGSAERRELRAQLSALFRHDSPMRKLLHDPALQLLHDADACASGLPACVGNFTDCMASLYHVDRAGRQFRPESPVYPNYRYVPVAYHSRASSVRPSGTAVIRPQGQVLKSGGLPGFAASQQLDFETEVALWICGENALGERVPIDEASSRIAGVGLLNDWSSRDIQYWESLPLGPFLGKNFLTSVSPWIVTLEALAPFRVPLNVRPDGDPQPLPYLCDPGDQARGSIAMNVETFLLTKLMAASGQAPHRLARASLQDLYWTPAQLIAHHTSNGCNLCPGDLIGTGTVSGPEEHDAGCLLELTRRGSQPLLLPNGEQRRWLEDGDEIIIRAHCERPGFASIGFGECRGRVSPASG